jgi:DNA-directed RNA polymerase specialized sigma54-like protein
MSSLSLTQQQKLQVKLSPAQIQMIRLLEIPVAELQERIDEELQKNPMLEEAAETENDENLNEEEIYANEIEKEEYELMINFNKSINGENTSNTNTLNDKKMEMFENQEENEYEEEME